MYLEEKQKKVKGASYFFAVLIAVYFVAVLIIRFTGAGYHISIVQNIVLSQSMIFIPTLAYIFITKCDIKDTLRLRYTHWSMIFLVPVFIIAIEPFIALINFISMLWVENSTTELSTDLVAKYPLYVSVLLMAVTPGIVEELAYRGVILGSYRYSSRIWAIVVSGLMFGMMHMNINQMAYATVLGILLGLLAEATGSIFTTMYAHFCFNGISVLLNYFMWHNDIMKKVLESSLQQETSRSDTVMSIMIMMPVAVVGLAIAFSIMYALAVINGKDRELFGIFVKDRTPAIKKVHIVSVPLIISAVICMAYMILNEIIK